MRKTIIAFLLLWPSLLTAQLTTVSGTIKDPNGFRYRNGTILATLVISNTPHYTATGALYQPPQAPTGINDDGSFLMTLADVNALTPAGATWSFHVCSARGTIQPGSPLTAGPVCFDLTGVVITGTSVDLSSQLSAVAAPLAAQELENAGVKSINGQQGAFTFTGAGVSCSNLVCSFGGGAGTGIVGPGTTGQYAVFSGGTTVVGAINLAEVGNVINMQPGTVFTSTGSNLIATNVGGSLGFLASGIPAFSYNGNAYRPIYPTLVNSTAVPAATLAGNNMLNFNNTSPSPPANGRNITWQISGAQASAALVGDGSTNCLNGQGAYTPCSGGIGTGASGQFAIYTGTNTVAGSPALTSNGTVITPTVPLNFANANVLIQGNGISGLPVLSGSGGITLAAPGALAPSNATAGIPVVNPGSGAWFAIPAMTIGGQALVTGNLSIPSAGIPVTNGHVITPVTSQNLSTNITTLGYNLVGDGSTNCLSGQGTYVPCSGGGGGGVTSINTVPGAFSFTGAGVSCTGTTCTFSGTGTGIGGSGTAPNLAVFTAASSIGNAPITATTSGINFGAGVPLTPSSPAALTGGLKTSISQSTPSCVGGNVIPLTPTTNVGCVGMDLQYNGNNSTNSGTSAGIIVRANGASSSGTGTLGMGIVAVETSSSNMTEQRAGYFEADSGQFTGIITTSRGLMGVAVNTNGTVATNEAIVAQSGAIGASGVNTSDYSVHCLPPLTGGTMTTHACVKIEPQVSGVEFQTGAHVFANLPPCAAAYEGSLAAITDSTVTAGTVSGGGSNHVLTYCNGTAWTVSGGGGGGTGGAPSSQVCAIPNTIAFATNTGNLNFCTFNLPAVAHPYIVRCVAQVDVNPGATQTTDIDLGVSLTLAPATATKFMSTYRDPGANAIFLQDNLLNAATGNQNLTTHSVTGNVTSVSETTDGVLNVPATAQTVSFYVGMSLAGANGNLLAGSYCKLD